MDAKGLVGCVKGVFLSCEEKVSKKNSKYHVVKIGNPSNCSNITLFLDAPIYEKALMFNSGEEVLITVDFQPRGFFANPVAIDIEKGT